MVIGHLDISVCEVQILPKFLMGCLPFFLIPRSSFYILNMSPLLCYKDLVLCCLFYFSSLFSLFCWLFCFIPDQGIPKLSNRQKANLGMSEEKLLLLPLCLTQLHHLWQWVLLDAQIRSTLMVFNVQVLTNKKTTFFGDYSLSMIDYLIWPWFACLEALELNKWGIWIRCAYFRTMIIRIVYVYLFSWTKIKIFYATYE